MLEFNRNSSHETALTKKLSGRVQDDEPVTLLLTANVTDGVTKNKFIFIKFNS